MSLYNSVVFDGNGDALTVSAAGLNLSTGDFTVEFWMAYAGSSNLYPTVFGNNPGGWQAGAAILHMDHTAHPDKLSFWAHSHSAASAIAVSSTTFLYNRWYHIALTRSGTTVKLYVNGNEEASSTISAALAFDFSTLNIGGGNWNGVNGDFAGHLSDFRIVKGAVVYTSNFNKPTAPLTAIAGTELLTAQSSTIVDNSANNYTVTAVGNAAVSAFDPHWRYNSVVFDGNGDYLLAANANLAPGTGDFTYEAWVYANSASDTPIFETRSAFTTDGFTLTAFNSSVIRIFSGSVLVSSSSTDYLNKWIHIAVVRQTGTTTFFINGASVGTTAALGNLTNADIVIGGGRYGEGSSVTSSFDGHISNFRFVRGTAVYTSNFSVPTAPLTAIAGTELLTAQSSSFVDNSANNLTITAAGNAAVSSVDPHWRYNSVVFDGSGDYLNVASNAAFAYGTGDFTVEFWLKPNDLTTAVVYDQRNGSGVSAAPTIYHSSGSLRYFASGNDRISGGTLTQGAWNHVALSRASGSTKMFLNGTQVGSTFSDSIDYITSPVRIMAGNDGGALNEESGYISNFRIVNGTAVYTENFTVPTAPLTAISGTSLLTAQSSTIVDNSANNFTVTAVGNAAVSGEDPFNDGITTTTTTTAAPTTTTTTTTTTAAPTTTTTTLPPRINLLTKTEQFDDVVFTDYHGAYTRTANAITAPDGTLTADRLQITQNAGIYRDFSQAITLVAGNRYTFSLYVKPDTTNWFYFGYTDNVSAWWAQRFNIATGELGEITTGGGGVSIVSTTCEEAEYGFMRVEIVMDITITRNVATTMVLIDNGTTWNGSVGLAAYFWGIDIRLSSNDIYGYQRVDTASVYDAPRLLSSGNVNYLVRSHSVVFDGNGDYLTIPSNAAFGFGTDDFTIEMWLYPRSYGTGVAGPSLFGTVNGNTAGYSFQLGQNQSAMRLTSNLSGGWADNLTVSAGGGPELNKWTHLAFVRSGSNITFYKDGTSVASGNGFGAFNFAANTIVIGRFNDGDPGTGIQDFDGYISNLRVVKGTAVYTGNFIVPTAPLDAISGTSLLTAQTSAIADNSANNSPITVFGNAAVSTADPFDLSTTTTTTTAAPTTSTTTTSTSTTSTTTTTTVNPNAVSARYVRWQITGNKGGSVTQGVEFLLYNNGSVVEWNPGVTITNPGGSDGGFPEHGVSELIDRTGAPGSSPSWYGGGWIDFGFSSNGNISTVIIDNQTALSFSDYSFVTRWDTENGDPDDWTVSISDDGTNWTVVSTVANANITSSRLTETAQYPVAITTTTTTTTAAPTTTTTTTTAAPTTTTTTAAPTTTTTTTTEAPIVTDGLLVHLDAANLSSFSGSGSTWFDLSGNGNNFSLYNSPTFSSGRFIFDGINDWAKSNSSLDFSQYSAITVEIFSKVNSSNNCTVLFEHTPNWNTNIGGLGVGVNCDGVGYNVNLSHSNWNSFGSTNYSTTADVWNHQVHVFSKNDASGRQIFVNGNIVSSQTVGNSSLANSNFFIGSRNGSAGFFAGDISVIRIYGKKLTANEVVQNYNAQSGRYDLNPVTTTTTTTAAPTTTTSTTSTTTTTTTAAPTTSTTTTSTSTTTTTTTTVAPITSFITDGLIVHLDAANSSSYSGTGTQWTDLSGNNNHGTLVNGVTFSVQNGGILITDGVNDQIDIELNLTNSNYTVIAATRFVTVGGRGVAAKYNNWLMGHWQNTTENHYAEGWISPEAAGSSDTNWRVYSASNFGSTKKFYVNGQLRNTGSGGQGPNGFAIGRGHPNEFGNIAISFFLVYNRELSAQEILQTYNFIEQRVFGATTTTTSTTSTSTTTTTAAPSVYFEVDASNNSSYNGSGSTWFDLSAAENDLTLAGTYSHAADSSVEYFDFADSAGTATSPVLSKFTSSHYGFEGWFRFEESSGTARNFFKISNGPDSDYAEINLDLQANSLTSLRLHGGWALPGANTALGFSSLSLNQQIDAVSTLYGWTHVAIAFHEYTAGVYPQANIRVFINGVERSVLLGMAVHNHFSAIPLTNANNSGNPPTVTLSGDLVSYAKLHNTELTSQMIVDSYNARVGDFPAFTTTTTTTAAPTTTTTTTTAAPTTTTTSTTSTTTSTTSTTSSTTTTTTQSPEIRMATTIQIKRSSGVSAPTTAVLAEGELAYSQDRTNEGAGAILYIESVAADGTTAVVDKVGGKYYTNTVDTFLTPKTASAAAKIALHEAGNNGSNKITLAAPALLGADVNYVLPGTITDGYFLKTDASGNLSWALVESTFTITGDTGTDTFNTGQTLDFAGTANQIVTAVTDNTVTFSLAENVSITGDLTVGGNDIKMSGGTTALTFSGTGDVATAGDLKVGGNDIKASDDTTAITLSGADVDVKGDLTVTGNDIKSSSATALTLSGADVEVKGDLQVTGNDIKMAAGVTALTFSGSGDVEVAGDLKVGGNDIKAGDGTTAITMAGADVTVAGDLQVTGNDIKMAGGTTALTFSGSGDVATAGDLKVGGNDIKAGDGTTAITMSGADVTVAGDLQVTGNDIKMAGGGTALTFSGSGDVEVKGDLQVTGNDIKSSTGATAITLDGANVAIAGDLTVNGTTTTVNSTTVTIDDNLIKLADNNIANTLDTGLYAKYVEAATDKFAGLFRDASDSNVFKLFHSLEVEPSTTVNAGHASYVRGTLEANLTGGTISNLAADLAVADGGTGASTFTTNGVLFGNGTDPIQVTAAGTNGQVLQVNSSGVPTFAMLDGGTY